jgi:beta-fructofuranosidase
MSNDSWRPKLHLAPYRGSISDPNGLCQFKGTYHFFCQNAPTYPGDFDSPHGWGHFASRDLVNYVFLGCHIFPGSPADADGSYSGGAYINEDADEVWFYYTGNVRDGEGDGTTSGRLANQTLMRSYNGINMEGKEVVLDNSGYPAYCSCHVRDPKVWKQDGKLHMLLGARTLADSRGAIMMYDSEDGYHWTMAGSVTNLVDKPFGYMWECPDRIVLADREFLSTCPQGMMKAIESQDSTRAT